MRYFGVNSFIMKNIYFLALLIFIFSVTLKAQETPFAFEKINGSNFVKYLFNERYQFNKSLVKHSGKLAQLPQAKSLLLNGKGIIVFDGYDYLIDNKQVVEIKGIFLSKNTLAAISSKLSKLDDYQMKCSESVNAEYKKDQRNLHYIKNIDRQYFSYLKQISSLTADIAQKVRKPNASVTIEMAMDRVIIPALSINNNKNPEILFAKAR